MTQVVGVAHTFVEVWSSVATVLAEMDVLLGFADLAVTAPTPFVRPTMLPPDDSSLVLVRPPIPQKAASVDAQNASSVFRKSTSSCCESALKMLLSQAKRTQKARVCKQQGFLAGQSYRALGKFLKLKSMVCPCPGGLPAPVRGGAGGRQLCEE